MTVRNLIRTLRWTVRDHPCLGEGAKVIGVQGTAASGRECGYSWAVPAHDINPHEVAYAVAEMQEIVLEFMTQ